ncbi:MAG: hypothetical protein J6Y03_05140 [Alphaproteobacteria bacterium]|nr:hypothetical protein [Alphaproteobacteria bacterium]
MYESGLSKFARILFLIMAVSLGIIFILSGCSLAEAAEQEVSIETTDGTQHHFFWK